MNLPIYFDYASTTPVRSEVLNKMLPYFSTLYGNAGSNLHHFGWLAQEAIDLSRNQIDELKIRNALIIENFHRDKILDGLIKYIFNSSK